MTRLCSSVTLPKVMIRCPATGHEVPTGFTAVSAAKLERLLRGSLLVKCAACSQHHEWSNRDAFLR